MRWLRFCVAALLVGVAACCSRSGRRDKYKDLAEECFAWQKSGLSCEKYLGAERGGCRRGRCLAACTGGLVVWLPEEPDGKYACPVLHSDEPEPP